MNCLNNAPPLVFPFSSNVVVAGNLSVVGIAGSVGSPQQPLSFAVDLSNNNTVVAPNRYCNSTGDDLSCVTQLGGVYDPNLSNTVQVFSSRAGWNGSFNPTNAAGNFSAEGGYVWYEDNVSVNDYNLSNFPFYTEISDIDGLQPTRLGLGFNSTFIHALITAGFAPSSRYGFWTGVNGFQQLNGESGQSSATNPGQLIVGGHDEGKYTGEPVAFESSPIFQPSAVYNAQLVDILLGSTSLFPKTNASIYQAALDPNLGFVQLPATAYQSFLSLTGGESVSFEAGTINSVPFNASVPRYNSGYTINSSLTIILLDSNGDNYTTTIPASWLMGDSENYYTQPGYQFATVSSTNTTLFCLGIPYMTFNYLISVLDGYEYFMAPIAVNSSLTPNIRSICPYTPSTSSSSNAASGQHASVAAIVGGVLGGIFALLLAVILLFVLRHHHRQKAERRSAQAELAASATSSENSTTAVDENKDRREKGHELWTSNHNIELAGSPFRPEELGGKWILEALGSTRLPTEMRGSSHLPKELEASDTKDGKDESPSARVIEGGPFEME